MLEVLHHRGPDSEGRSVGEFAAIGLRRLAILDLRTGDQPLASEDGSIECFLNGEIYNHAPLREELESRGHRFRTTSDTETLPHLYEEFGEEMFSRLNGMFCVVVIDRPARRVLLARDPVGVKQLYYAETPAGVVFASEMKGLLASGLLDPELDRARVLPYLTLFYSPSPRTLVKGVRKLHPGTYVEIDDRGLRAPRPYRSLPLGVRNGSHPAPPPDLAEETYRRLRDAVSLQLNADVPVGISLSGGLDSSAIAHLARECTSKPISAFTIRWDPRRNEEVEASALVCRHLGLRHEVLEPPARELSDELVLLAWMSDEPISDPATYSQFVIAREASRHVKVLLSGAGGDELFGGYPSYFLSARRWVYAHLPSFLRPVAELLPQTGRLETSELDALARYRGSRFPWHALAMSQLGHADLSILRSMLPESEDPYEGLRDVFEDLRDEDPLNQQMLADLSTYLPEQILPMIDRATMAASVEGRVPFLDLPLVDFVLGLPGRAKVGLPATSKRLLRRSFRARLPRAVVAGRKSGFPSPLTEWLRSHPLLFRRVLLDRRDSLARRLFPIKWLGSLLDRSSSGFRSLCILYSLLILEIWNKLFLEDRTFGRPEGSLEDHLRVSLAP